MIKEAAILKDGFIYTGKRHHNILNNAKPFGALRMGLQGFVTFEYEFVDRYEAAKIAWKCHQIDEKIKKLHSEDLY